MLVMIFNMDLESLLQLYAKKDSLKKKKIRTIFKTIEHNIDTNVYKCRSFRYPDQSYYIHWDSKEKSWWCSCEAKLFKKYKQYQTLKERKQNKNKVTCVHILSILIHRALNDFAKLKKECR